MVDIVLHHVCHRFSLFILYWWGIVFIIKWEYLFSEKDHLFGHCCNLFCFKMLWYECFVLRHPMWWWTCPPSHASHLKNISIFDVILLQIRYVLHNGVLMKGYLLNNNKICAQHTHCFIICVAWNEKSSNALTHVMRTTIMTVWITYFYCKGSYKVVRF